MSGSTRFSPQFRNWIAAGCCALAVLACILLINPRVEMGARDDWSYIYSAMKFASTGRIIYNGWSTATLGIQLYVGALFVRLFGASFTAVRASSMVAGILCAPVMYAVLVRARIRPWNATLGTLTLVLSPLFLPLASTYMSDIFALFLLLAFFYAGMRCYSAATDRASVSWLVATAVVGMAAGTIRQIACVSVLIVLPAIVIHLRRRRGMLQWGIPLYVLCVLLVLGLVHWFQRQPYAVIEPLFNVPLSVLRHEIGFVLRGVVSFALLLSPVLTGIALRFRSVTPRQRTYALLALAVATLVVIGLTLVRGGSWWGSLLLGDYVTVAGIIYQPEVMGIRPEAIPPILQAVFAYGLLVIAMFSTATIWSERRAAPISGDQALNATLRWIFLPFTVGYLGLVYTRNSSFDRYYLPLIPIAIVFAMRWYEDHHGQRFSRLCALPLLLLCAYGVAGTHDQFAILRARLAAAEELRAAGIPRNEFYGGFEYDAWTQVDIAGHVNEPRIRPVTAYTRVQLPAGLIAITPSDAYPWRQARMKIDQNCFAWFRPYTPAIHARYQFQGESGFCFPDSKEFTPVRYKTWLPPHDRGIYIAEMPDQFR